MAHHRSRPPDHASYFPGHGVAFTAYTHCATGAGHTPGEALEDALSGISPPCAWEWRRANWGREWADKMHPNHPHSAKTRVTKEDGK